MRVRCVLLLLLVLLLAAPMTFALRIHAPVTVEVDAAESAS